MQSITNTYSAKIEIKKSTFLAFLCPYDDFENLLKNLKQEHLKAVHFVYAYRYLNDLNQIVEDKSDDGEPKGTSGMPSLNVLRGFELVNVAVIIVRYFGGIKLGTGGLVRAYSDAVNEVVCNSILIPFEIKKHMQILIDIKNLRRFEYFLNTHSLNFKREFSNEKVILKFDLNDEEEQKFENFCKNFAPFEIEKNIL
ncbi:IMPACT family protein [Campylobacter estrildidarum]|uniref:Phosphoenolpyruvate carboxykinase n=1 Tax=Campylobacter estrildidarum TaxID=2510189 RepID=A0A4U7BB58_9BACT|nr:YigZ family protein [Campylobacter estrildidarum]TKX28568.1 phosphoenolpyruvate carboxykinase [Campylobacter estrildidarum]